MDIAIQNLNSASLQKILDAYNADSTSGATAAAKMGENGFITITVTGEGGVSLGSFNVAMPDLDAADISSEDISAAQASIKDKLDALASNLKGVTSNPKSVITTTAVAALFSIYKLMALLMEVAQKQRETAAVIRNQQHQNVQASLMSEASSIRSAAETSFIIGVVSAAVQGAISIASLTVAAVGTAKQASAMKQSGVSGAHADFYGKNTEVKAAKADVANAETLTANANEAAANLPKTDDNPPANRPIPAVENVDVPNGRAVGDQGKINANNHDNPTDPLAKLDAETRKTYFAETDNAKGAVVETKAALDDAKAKLEAKQNEVSGKQEELSQETNELDELKATKTSKESEISEKETRIAELEKNLKNQNKMGDVLKEQEELVTLRADVAKLKDEVKTVDTQISTKQARVETLTNEIATGKEAIAGLQTKVDGCSKEYTKACDNYGAALNKDLDYVKKNLSKAEANLREAEAHADKNSVEVNNARTRLDDIKKLNAFAEAYKKAEDSNTVLPGKVEAMEGELKVLQEKYDMALRSFQNSAGNVWAQSRNQIMQGVSAIINVGGQICQMIREKVTAGGEAEAKEYAAQREGYEAQADEAKDMRETAKQMVDAVIALLRAVLEAENESMRSAIQA